MQICSTALTGALSELTDGFVGTEEADSASYLRNNAYSPQSVGTAHIHPPTHTSSAQDTTTSRPQHIGLEL